MFVDSCLSIPSVRFKKGVEQVEEKEIPSFSFSLQSIAAPLDSDRYKDSEAVVGM